MYRTFDAIRQAGVRLIDIGKVSQHPKLEVPTIHREHRRTQATVKRCPLQGGQIVGSSRFDSVLRRDGAHFFLLLLNSGFLDRDNWAAVNA